MRLTATNLISMINQLPKNVSYNYITPSTKTQIKITRVVRPEGPIFIKRYNPSQGKSLDKAVEESISTQMIWRIANAFRPDQPINFDRVLGGSYNTRSAFEALLAHTPEFYFCYPGRIEGTTSTTEVKKGHKHLIWSPSVPHQMGVLSKKETELIISEVPSAEVVYDTISVSDEINDEGLDIDIKRRHSQMQIALIEIGVQLGFRTWIAQNDKGIIYKEQRIAEMRGVVDSLDNENMIYPYDGAISAARLIDCIWFKNGKLMPAVIEVEHSTGVTSGLTRMKGLKDALPAFSTRYVIVAADEERDKVLREANRPQFRDLDVKFFPYSAVEELYSLCQRRRIIGVSEEFIDSFMESTISDSFDHKFIV